MKFVTMLVVHFFFFSLSFVLDRPYRWPFCNINRAAQVIRDVRVLFRSDSGDPAPSNRCNCQMRLQAPVFLQVGFPAVRATEHTVEKEVVLLARNFETDGAEAPSRRNRLPTFATSNGCLKFYTSPAQPCLFFLVRQLVS